MRMFQILKSIQLLLFCCYLSACGSGSDNDNSSNQSNPDSEAPTAVSNVIDTTTYQSVTLTWNAASDNVGIDHYQIMRDGDAIGTTQATSFTDRTVNENSDYTYSVIAYDAAGNSSTSASIRVSVPANSNGGTDTEAPSAVTNLDVSSTYQAVTLSWSAATGNVEEVNAGTGSWGARIPSDLMQGLSATTPPTDSDNDGMPDDWENSHGLSNTTDDHNSVMSSGYTAIEVYINELADQSLSNGAAATNDLTTLDANISPVTSGNWYRPGVETTWTWQLQGTLNTGYPVKLTDID